MKDKSDKTNQPEEQATESQDLNPEVQEALEQQEEQGTLEERVLEGGEMLPEEMEAVGQQAEQPVEGEEMAAEQAAGEGEAAEAAEGQPMMEEEAAGMEDTGDMSLEEPEYVVIVTDETMEIWETPEEEAGMAEGVFTCGDTEDIDEMSAAEAIGAPAQQETMTGQKPEEQQATPQETMRKVEERAVSGMRQLTDTVSNLLKESTVRRIRIKNKQGRILLDIPVWMAAIGGSSVVLTLPLLSSLTILGSLIAGVTVEVEREEPNS